MNDILWNEILTCYDFGHGYTFSKVEDEDRAQLIWN